MYFINLNVMKLDWNVFSINAYNIWKQLIVIKKILQCKLGRVKKIVFFYNNHHAIILNKSLKLFNFEESIHNDFFIIIITIVTKLR